MKGYIAKNLFGKDSYALDGCVELGIKKYARKFKTKKEAYSYMWKYFRLNKNDVRIEEVCE